MASAPVDPGGAQPATPRRRPLPAGAPAPPTTPDPDDQDLKSTPELCPEPPARPPPIITLPLTRPGILFQNLLLRDFFSTAAPASIAPSQSSPADLWVTPAATSPSLCSKHVANILNFNLTSPPVSLRVESPLPRVFRTRVASENVARFIALRGYLRVASSSVVLHLSMEDAMNAAASLHEEDAFNAAPQTGNPAVTALTTSLAPTLDLSAPAPSQPTAPSALTKAPAKRRYAYLLVLSGPEAQSLPPLLPSPAHTMHSASDKTGHLEPNAVLTPATRASRDFTPATKPYLRAVLSPAAPPRHDPPSTPFKPPANGCFRCLASDHQVQRCRDPVRCRRCGVSGHMERNCRSPRWPRRATPWPRRPTVPVPAGRVPVQPVPFSNADITRLSSATPPPPTSAPPSSPLLTPPPFPPAFNPLNLIASSSSSAPDFQLQPTPTTAATTTPPSPPTAPRPPPLTSTSPPPPNPLPPLLEVHCTTSPSRPTPVRISVSHDAGSGGRSPPSEASPVRVPAPVPLADAGVGAGSDDDGSGDGGNDGSSGDDDEVEFVNSYGSPD
ncbi:unnamed protein product [Urochloa humidicola]